MRSRDVKEGTANADGAGRGWASAVGIFALLLIGATGAAAWSRWSDRGGPAGTPTTRASSPVTPGPLAGWCAAGYEPLAGDGCLASPPTQQAPSPLVVYLHGRYARDAAGEEMDRQRRLAARATSRGFAVLALRGRLGGCRAPELATWFCWPSNEQTAEAAPALVREWEEPLAEARARVGSGRRFVLGFSSGGYFAGLLAVRDLFGADAFAIAHGGPVEPVHAVRGRPPLLLLSADDDVAQDDMLRFDALLGRDEWTARDSYARAGGHGLTDQDIDSALAFFARSGGRVPLDPPLPLHRPAPHARGVEEASAPEAPQVEPEGDVVEEPTP
jgi:dienelactone hydrolase